MIIRICDYCGEKGYLHQIKLTQKPNAEPITAELCDTCLTDISKYVNNLDDKTT